MKAIIKIAILSTLLLSCFGATLTDVQRLFDDLLNNSIYNKHLRGVFDQDKIVQVETNFSLIGIGNVMELEEAFEVTGILQMSWVDERLIWKPEDYNGTSELLVFQDMIWKPEVKLSNPLLDMEPLGNDRTHTRITHTGKVYWATPHQFKATCKLNVVSFPWDRQSCALRFTVSGYTQREVTIDLDRSDVDLSLFEGQESWHLAKTSAVSIYSHNSNVEYWFCVERRPAFHVSVIFFPVVALSFLSLFTFILRIDSGERISFSVTILLSITVDLTMMYDLLPSHSKGMASIIFYLNAVLGESALICIISILNMHVYHREGTPPSILGKIYTIVFCRRFVKVIEVKLDEQDDKKEIIPELNHTRIPCRLPESSLITWMDVSRLIDRICFSLASLLLGIFYLVFGFNVTMNIVDCAC